EQSSSPNDSKRPSATIPAKGEVDSCPERHSPPDPNQHDEYTVLTLEFDVSIQLEPTAYTTIEVDIPLTMAATDQSGSPLGQASAPIDPKALWVVLTLSSGKTIQVPRG